MTGAEAVETWGDELEVLTPDGQSAEQVPDLAGADTSSYEPCDGLSAIVVPYSDEEGAAGGNSYSQVLLFEDGEYIGTDTDTPRQWTPEIVRVGEDTLEFTYGYGNSSDVLGPEGYVVSTFTWDEDSQTLEHEGELPPAV